MLNTTQAFQLATLLRSRGIDGGRVARLAMGVAPFQLGDYDLLIEAAFASSGSEGRVVAEDIYEILCQCAQDAAYVTGDSGGYYRSARVVPLA